MASALLAIRAEYRGPRFHFYVFKPLTVVLIILVALQSKHVTGASYKSLVVGGLVCSLVGDVFLMLPGERFVASDSVLAWDRFGGKFRSAQALILSTYFAAQWLIAVST